MTALLATVLITSLLGSLHCAGMCGPFVALATCGGGTAPLVQVGRRLGGAPWAVALAYHAGRAFTYVLLGGIAGAAGAALDLGAGLLGLQRVAMFAAGALMVLFGATGLLRVAGVMIRGPKSPPLIGRVLGIVTRRASMLPPIPRAGLIGLVTTMLPCGWLYAFVVTAAGTGSPLWGAAAMAAFWVGTLPMLVGLGFGLQMLTAPLRAHAPLLTGIALVVIGGLTVAGRFTIDLANIRTSVVAPKNIADSTAQAATLNTLELPCCRTTASPQSQPNEGQAE